MEAVVNGKAAIDKVVDRASKADEAAKEEADKKALELEKDKAKADIDQYATDAKKKIDALDKLTPEQKQDFKDQIDNEATKAKDAIDAATDKNGVDQAVVDGKKAIDSIVKKAQDLAGEKEEADKKELDQAKEDAKKEIDSYAKDAKDKVEALDNLTPEEKKDFTDKIDAVRRTSTMQPIRMV